MFRVSMCFFRMVAQFISQSIIISMNVLTTKKQKKVLSILTSGDPSYLDHQETPKSPQKRNQSEIVSVGVHDSTDVHRHAASYKRMLQTAALLLPGIHAHAEHQELQIREVTICQHGENLFCYFVVNTFMLMRIVLPS